MKKLITIKQYEKAKKIVDAYLLQTVDNLIPEISTDDLLVLYRTIAIPKLTISIIDEYFIKKLESSLEDLGYSIDYISLDDMGYVSIAYRESFVEEVVSKDLIKVLKIIK